MALAAALLCSCGKNSDPEKPIEKPDPSVVPAPPEEIISNNTFVVDYFTDMKDSESYFSKRDVNVAKEYILGDVGRNSVMYFFDRMDFTVGKTSPAVKMCTNMKIYPEAVSSKDAESSPRHRFQTSTASMIRPCS